MKTYSDLSDDEIEQKLDQMNRQCLIIQMIIIGVIMIIAFWGYMYIWCLGPFHNILPNVNAIQASAIHMTFVISTTLFVGDIITYATFLQPIFFAVHEYDLKYGRYSKKKVK